MSEGNPVAMEHSESTRQTVTAAAETTTAAETLSDQKSSRQKSSRQRKAIQIAAATAVVLLIVGIMFQRGRAQATNAAEQTGSATPGTASRNTGQLELAAKVTRNGRSIQIPLDKVARECLLRIGNDVLDSMLNRAVIQLACEERGVTVTQTEVEQEIMRIAKQFKIPAENWIAMLQQERNISPEQYSRDIIWPMLALKKLAGSQVDITDQDLHKAFIRHYGPRVKCRMIMLDNLRRANEVWQKAKLKPDEFERLARDNSVDPNSRSLGGSVPPIARYSGNEEIAKAAFKLREGEISHIINLGFNRYVILRCDGFTKQLVTDQTQVQAELHADLVEQKVQEQVAKLFESLKKTTRIDNYWNQTTTGDVTQVSGRNTGNSGVRQAAGVRPTDNRTSTGSPAAARQAAGRASLTVPQPARARTGQPNR